MGSLRGKYPDVIKRLRQANSKSIYVLHSGEQSYVDDANERFIPSYLSVNETGKMFKEIQEYVEWKAKQER